MKGLGSLLFNRHKWKRAAKVSGQLAVENFCCGLGDAAASNCNGQ